MRYVLDYEPETVAFRGMGAGHAGDLFLLFHPSVTLFEINLFLNSSFECGTVLSENDGLDCNTFPQPPLDLRVKEDFMDAIYHLNTDETIETRFPEWKSHKQDNET